MIKNAVYIEVAVAIPVFNTYSYSVPDSLVLLARPGCRVLVPFGKRRVTGYILDHYESDRWDEKNSELDIGKTKQILDVLDDHPLFPVSLVSFFQWISDYYLYPIGEVIKCALPGGINFSDSTMLSVTRKGRLAIRGKHGNPLERSILDRIEKKPGPIRGIRRVITGPVPDAVFHTMVKKGWLEKKTMLAGGKTRSMNKKFVSLNISSQKIGTLRDNLTAKRMTVLNVLETAGEISLKDLIELAGVSRAVINALADSGYVSIHDKKIYRDPLGDPVEPDTPLQLTNDQERVLAEIIESLDKGFCTFLLAGVTGSGKTEVYLQLCAEVLKRGRPVLILVPEIALISQIEHRFRARFGDRVALLHSGLSSGERYDQWLRILNQKAVIAIGARSAVFAPFKQTGVIIVDEEHDSSYKQEGSLRYHARDLAVVRAKLDQGVALLGSATPSIQTYYNAVSQKFIELNLNKRVEQRSLPEISIIDLRETRDLRGTRRFISDELNEAMTAALTNKKQVLLFLNRRGFAGFPICGSCGESIKCKNCDITLTLHKGINAYKCHYCGFMRPSAAGCKICGSNSIKNLGIGTEKVEAAVKSLFPEARCARMDRDTTSRKGSIVRILKSLKNNEIDILIGTQMVAKGHDFPNITLVGIICADFSLNFPDFRAGERTFQLLAQVAGRAGRGDTPGRVILQTYNPEHFSILAAKTQDFKKFYHQEISFRKALNYPPYSRIVLIKVSGRDKKLTAGHALALGELCRNLLEDGDKFRDSIEVLGPIEASIVRIANMYRWQILLKGINAAAIQGFIHRLVFENHTQFNNPKVKAVVDVDPFFMM